MGDGETFAALSGIPAQDGAAQIIATMDSLVQDAAFTLRRLDLLVLKDEMKGFDMKSWTL